MDYIQFKLLCEKVMKIDTWYPKGSMVQTILFNAIIDKNIKYTNQEVIKGYLDQAVNEDFLMYNTYEFARGEYQLYKIGSEEEWNKLREYRKQLIAREEERRRQELELERLEEEERLQKLELKRQREQFVQELDKLIDGTNDITKKSALDNLKRLYKSVNDSRNMSINSLPELIRSNINEEKYRMYINKFIELGLITKKTSNSNTMYRTNVDDSFISLIHSIPLFT